MLHQDLKLGYSLYHENLIPVIAMIPTMHLVFDSIEHMEGSPDFML